MPEVEEVQDQVAPEAQDQNQSEPDGSEPGEALKNLSQEELVELALKYRHEAANNRKKGNTKLSEAQQKLQDDAKKWQEHLDSQKSETEKALDRAKELENELTEYRTQKRAKAVAESVKDFPMDLMDVLSGDEDSMRATAERLAKREAGKGKASPVSDIAGNRGNPVRSKTNSGGGFLEALADKDI